MIHQVAQVDVPVDVIPVASRNASRSCQGGNRGRCFSGSHALAAQGGEALR